MMDRSQGGGYPADPVPGPGAVATFVNVVGALVSIALVVGVAVWGYRLSVRDVSAIPVIAAMAGPMRSEPDGAGTPFAPNQGLAVNSVQADRTVAAPEERIVLAPAPVDLAEEDKARPKLRPAARVAADAPAPAASVPDEEPIAPVAAIDLEAEGGIAAAIAALTADVRPLEGTPDPEPAADGTTVEPGRDAGTQVARAGAIPASVPGVARSPRPKARPAIDPASVTGTADTRAPSEGTVDADPASIRPGEGLVQLGAFDTREVAVSEWERLLGAHADLLSGQQRLIQQASGGGRTFYRLRVAGFDSVDEARRMCAAFQYRNTPCIPVVAR